MGCFATDLGEETLTLRKAATILLVSAAAMACLARTP
jgi:hypothetical protein